MNNQEAFDQVWRHFVVDKQPQSLEDGGCMYRGANGAKCAVGVLIPDSLYKPQLEGYIVCQLDPKLYGNADVSLVGDMQRAHDHWVFGKTTPTSFTAHMEIQLRKIAATYHLSIPGE